ncbi:hypothetical protein TELCIR_09667 [Teladorsagia circumcincta]|uniref:Uncharacterized protein n=1 Tax=Teladorsagia circumcincta TaxID=45464 RepID=A0A2G9UEG0_TELCI|nr:hypothetical protein TELCIR_09667 [Teladorsagia circumcincta]
MIGNVLITFNRYSALCLTQKYNKIWMRRNVWIAIGIQYVAALALYIQTVRTKMVYHQNADGSSRFAGLEKHVDQNSKYHQANYEGD